MILDNEVTVTINPSNYNYYKTFYNNIKVKDIVTIKIKHLYKGSKTKINVKCDMCGKEKYIIYSNYILYGNINGNYICRSCKMCMNNMKKYGVDNVFKLNSVKNKIKKTILEKYGVNNISQSTKIKNKKIKTNKKKFGVEYPIQLEKIKQKSKISCLKKYGVDNISKLPSIKKQKENSCLKNYGVKYISQSKNFKENLKPIILKKLKSKYNNIIDIIGDDYKFFCGNCKNEYLINKKAFYTRYNLNINICTICNPIGSFSKSGEEKIIYKIINNNCDKKIDTNKRDIISPLELDIYIPELRLAFEFNGLYWHNELYKDKNYHLNKTELCEKKGIQLIHIWEDNWINKQDIVKSMILNKLGKTPNKIYGRKTIIKEITDNKIVRNFLETNHLQGFIGSKIKLGLFFENELVSLMIFGKRRIAMGKKLTNEGEYELLRYCNKLNTNVLGGASKLFKYFIENFNPKEITTYADRSHSNGKLYKQLGFKFISKTQPNYFYIINGIRKHRFNFRKDKLIKEGFDSNKTEHQIMLNRNIYRIYDSGNLKYVI